MRRQIIPSILASSLPEFKKRVKFLEPFFSLAQIDVLDKTLVPNKSFYELGKIRQIPTKLDYELHLMVSNPLKVIRPWLGYKKLKRAIIHIEAFENKTADLYAIISILEANKIKVGIAVNPETDLKKILPFGAKINFFLIMGVHPGWSGQKFIPSTLNKIKKLRKIYPNKHIAVDGGITIKNYSKILKSGANILNAASMIYQLSPVEIKKLKVKINA